MEVSLVRKQLQSRIAEAKRAAKTRREAISEAQAAYGPFLEHIAVPVARQVVGALRSEGFAWNVSTPSGGVRLSPETGRDDHVELTLDTAGDAPRVVGLVSRGRGSRLVREERVLADGASPVAITDEQVLAFLLDALTPWLER